MKKRIGYDYYFMPKEPHNGFIFNEEQIIGVSLMADFKIFINGEEMFFEEGKELEIFSCGSSKFYPTSFIKCHYDPENRSYVFKENKQLFDLAKIEGKKISFEYKATEYWKDLKNKEYPVNISKEEFDKILKTGNFNSDDNKPAQNLAYSLIDVKE